MFCTNCGKEIHNEAVVCPHCGAATENMKNFMPARQSAQNDANLFAVFGFALSIVALAFMFDIIIFIVMSLTAIALSIVGAVKSKTLKKGKGLSIAGIVIGSASIVLYFTALILISLFATSYLYLFFYLLFV